jgi:hypothetical protein
MTETLHNLIGRVPIDKAQIGIIFASMAGESRMAFTKEAKAGIIAPKRAYFPRKEGNRRLGIDRIFKKRAGYV